MRVKGEKHGEMEARVFPDLNIFERFVPFPGKKCNDLFIYLFLKFFDYTEFEFSVCYFKMSLHYMQTSILLIGIIHRTMLTFRTEKIV